MGALRVDVRASAAAEAERAHDWYLRRNAAAAERFLMALEQAFNRIGENPEMGLVWSRRRVGPDVRKVRLRRFPFQVFYLVQSDAVKVVAIAHAKRRPGYWRGRLRR